jgi:hypothetical protein
MLRPAAGFLLKSWRVILFLIISIKRAKFAQRQVLSKKTSCGKKNKMRSSNGNTPVGKQKSSIRRE